MTRPLGTRIPWPLALGLGMTALLLAALLFAPWIAPQDPLAADTAARLQPPSSAHWLGTDHLGRDQFARLVHGTRTSLGAVAAIAVLVLTIGGALGCLAGWLGGIVDAVIMRACDAFMTIPTLVLALFLIGILGTGLVNVVIAITLSHWAFYARLSRGITLSLRQRPYIAAARVAGGSQRAIVARHVLPEVAGQLLVLATLDLGHWMLHVAGLSFLGLGVEPPTPEWGIMINDARPYVWTHPMLIALPGGAILFTVVALNLLGDAAHARLDPRLDAHDFRHVH
jgi:nickel transport system permease protein